MASTHVLPAGVTAPSPHVAGLIAQGPIKIDIAAERALSGFDVTNPSFLRGVRHTAQRHWDWLVFVLGWIEMLTFVVSSTSEVPWFSELLSFEAMYPEMYRHVTRLELPGFHWFSGTDTTRPHNPSCQMAQQLPRLSHLSITLHTASITISRWSESEMLSLQQTDVERSKEREVMTYQDVIRKYDLQSLFDCKSLQVLRIGYIDCDRTKRHITVGDPMDVMGQIQHLLAHGFVSRARPVQVFFETEP